MDSGGAGLAFLIDGNMSVSVSGQGGLLLCVDPAETDTVQIVRSSSANSASKWRSAAPSSYMAVSAIVYPWAAPS